MLKLRGKGLCRLKFIVFNATLNATSLLSGPGSAYEGALGPKVLFIRPFFIPSLQAILSGSRLTGSSHNALLKVLGRKLAKIT